MSPRRESELYLHGAGHFHPGTLITNSFLEELGIGTSEAWVLERVGIRSRRTVLPLEYLRETRNADVRRAGAVAQFTSAQMGAHAARMALKRAGVSPEEIGLVISGACAQEDLIPAGACRVAAELGITAPALDISSACSSFPAQLHFLGGMRPEALPDYVLVVNPESMTRTVNYEDRSTAVLWGDGAAAVVISTRKKARMRIRSSVMHSDPQGWDKVCIPWAGHFAQAGSSVQAFAIKKSLATLTELRSLADRDSGSRGKGAYFIGHQANLLMLQAICERGEILPERHLTNVEEFGNTGAAGAPSVLSQNWDRFRSGDAIALVAVGSGLSWGGVWIEVAE